MLQRCFVARLTGGILITLGICASASAQIGRVSGVVREERGQPLKGATVIAENTNIGQSFTATTDDKGRFQMIGLRGGQWRFIAQAPGYSAVGALMNVRLGGTNAPLSFLMKRVGPTFFGALSGLDNKDLQVELAEADELYSEKKWDEAIEAYRAILGRAPVITSINLQIAAAYRQKKDYSGAIAAYNDLLKVDPANSKARVELAMTALEQGDATAAEATLTQAAAEPDAPREVFYSMGEVKLAADDADGAATWFQKAAAADPYWAKPLLRLSEAAMRKGDQAGAARLLARAVEVDPTAPEAATAKTVLASLNK